MHTYVPKVSAFLELKFLMIITSFLLSISNAVKKQKKQKSKTKKKLKQKSDINAGTRIGLGENSYH